MALRVCLCRVRSKYQITTRFSRRSPLLARTWSKTLDEVSCSNHQPTYQPNKPTNKTNQTKLNQPRFSLQPVSRGFPVDDAVSRNDAPSADHGLHVAAERVTRMAEPVAHGAQAPGWNPVKWVMLKMLKLIRWHELILRILIALCNLSLIINHQCTSWLSIS